MTFKFTEPQHTLSWTAWHIFDKQFAEKYESGELTIAEYRKLIDMCILRRAKHIMKCREWYQFRLMWKDMVFLNRLEKLRQALETKPARTGE